MAYMYYYEDEDTHVRKPQTNWHSTLEGADKELMENNPDFKFDDWFIIKLDIIIIITD